MDWSLQRLLLSDVTTLNEDHRLLDCFQQLAHGTRCLFRVREDESALLCIDLRDAVATGTE